MTTKADRRNARLRRLMQAGKIKPMSKAEQRQAIEQATSGKT